MARLPVGTYINFVDSAGADVELNMQNFHQLETRSFNGKSYIFGNFGFSGSALDISGANVTASLVIGVNDVSMPNMMNAVTQRWLVNVYTVWLDLDTLAEKNVWLTETYAITGLTHDGARMSVQLGSPLDAITANLPRRVLTHKLVGSLPPTGALVIS